jgi:hypothetical protein
VTVKKLVGNLAKDAVVTTASAARHPIGSAARVAGLVKGSAGAGLGLMREVVRGPGETEQPSEGAPEQSAAPEQPAVHDSSAPSEPEASDSSEPESFGSAEREATEPVSFGSAEPEAAEPAEPVSFESAEPEAAAPEAAEPEAAAFESSAPDSSAPDSPAPEASEPSVAEDPTGATTHKTPPGPDIVPKPVPTLDELPEPIVISAQD